MYRMVSRMLKEIDQWRENSRTDETLNSLTSIETFLEEIKEMNLTILREEEEAATEFPFMLKLLIKNIKIIIYNRQQFPDPTVVVRRDDITTTSPAKK